MTIDHHSLCPSPTGYLHLGHLVNAIYVWGLARAVGGRVLLLIVKLDGEKLSKASGDTAVRELRVAGIAPAAVIARAAAAVGLIDHHRPIDADAVSGLIDGHERGRN